ncbi:conjugal transfer protein [Streptococcus panodentis]|uniref:Conjugal transfer protein n=1 Tax=Streptococcus panodentis TaxID=1581472 RepID=A0ABS5AUT2_9STRE|nr:conjugal transfer protein [Streptococcus panodentis]MBP2620332.1 conjugal transfer protein [Streptococcus panodentis]
MKKLLLMYEQVQDFFSHFVKREKKPKAGGLKVVSKKTVNLAMLAGLIFILLVGLIGGIRAMTLSNKVTNLEQAVSKAQANQTVKPSETGVDNALEYYLNDFVYYYFVISENPSEQVEQAEKLKSFYGSEPDIQSQGQMKNPSELIWYRILRVKDNVATYQVRYKQKVKEGDATKEEEIATEFNIPYGQTDTGYYVAGLPWFTAWQSNQVKSVKDGLKLNQSDRVDEKTKKKLDKFLEVFFINYTTSQDNLDLVAKDIKTVNNTVFKTLDFSYYKEKKGEIVAYVQVTFEVAGSSHAENFTLYLSEKGKSYYINKMDHMIPSNYAK